MLRDLIPAFRFLGLGVYIGVCIFCGIILGFWLDNKFDTHPVCLLTGLVLGLITASWGVYRMVIPLIKKNNKKGGGKGVNG